MTATASRTISVRIEGTDPPARSCAGPDGVAIGIQRGKEVLEQVPSSTASPIFHGKIDITTGEGALDFRGPYAHGIRGDRFLYLAWVGIRDGGAVARIKLRFADVDDGLLANAAGGDTLVGRLSLVNPQGRPVSGTVRPPAVTWSLEATVPERP